MERSVLDDEPAVDPPSSSTPGARPGTRAIARGESATFVVAARRGDPEALDALVRRLAADLGPVCGAIALDDGDDALQETLVTVVRSLGDLREPAAVGAWARRIAVRESVRVAKRRARVAPLGRVAVEDVAADLAAVPVEFAAGVDRRLDVADVLARLEPRQRAVLVLRHLDGLDEESVAAMLDVPVGTVKSRTSRARDAFARRWRP